jgi:hypothetical protein
VRRCPETPQSSGKQYHAHSETFSLVSTEQIAPTSALGAGLDATMGVTLANPPFARLMNGNSGAAMMLLNVVVFSVEVCSEMSHGYVLKSSKSKIRTLKSGFSIPRSIGKIFLPVVFFDRRRNRPFQCLAFVLALQIPKGFLAHMRDVWLLSLFYSFVTRNINVFSQATST